MPTTHNTFPKEILEWLHSRTLSNETIDRFQLAWNGREIVIPVFNEDGILLFKKYRRDPIKEDTTIPKYRYDKGAHAVLFNASTLKDMPMGEPVIITEGELDCIAVENMGIRAVTTTGGSGTFQEEWVRHFSLFSNVLICFDNDPAGMKGAIRVQSLLPKARMLLLPYHGGKDVTEYLQRNGNGPLLSLVAEQFFIPADVEDSRDIKQVRAKIKEFKTAADTLQEQKRALVAKRERTTHIDFMLEYVSNHYALYKRTEKNLQRRPYTGGGDRVAAARAVPITNFIQFNKARYAPCIVHSEKTASMYYNNERSKYPNTVKCFGGCGFMGDTIDVVMQLNNLTFNEAVDFLTK